MLFGVGLLWSLEPVGTVASPLSLSILGLGYFSTNIIGSRGWLQNEWRRRSDCKPSNRRRWDSRGSVQHGRHIAITRQRLATCGEWIAVGRRYRDSRKFYSATTGEVASEGRLHQATERLPGQAEHRWVGAGRSPEAYVCWSWSGAWQTQQRDFRPNGLVFSAKKYPGTSEVCVRVRAGRKPG